jgi:hypothetical protein
MSTALSTATNLIGSITSLNRNVLAETVAFCYTTGSSTTSQDIHIYCPGDTRPLSLASLTLHYISTVRPTAMKDSLHGTFYGILCTTSSPDKLKHTFSTTLVPHYHFSHEQGTLKTDEKLWHRLITHIRHTASDIPQIHLIAGRNFWDFSCWKSVASEVLDCGRCCNNFPRGRDRSNFLAVIAKIAAPALRFHIRKRRGTMVM